MYLPAAFKQEDLAVVQGLMREHSFATLVTHGPEGAVVSHVPLLLDEGRGPYGVLRGHLARANRQWEQLREGGEALAVFHGPHAYISPSWYETALSVPTWNYTVVHAYGKPALLQEDDALLALLRELTGVYEAGSPTPWQVSDLPEELTRKLLGGIVGFEIEITRLEGKWKLGQNRAAADREGAVRGLRAAGDPQSLQVAALMEGAR